jgi:aminopeptidase
MGTDTSSRTDPLDLYARVLVARGTGLRPGQDLYIRGQRDQRDFALRIGEAAYELGAGRVRYLLVDPLETEQLIRRAQPEQIEIHHLDNHAWYQSALAARAGLIFLYETEPVVTSQPRVPTVGSRSQIFVRGAQEAYGQFLRLALDRRLCPCTIAPVPTAAWAERVFPALSRDRAFARLLNLMLRFTHGEEGSEAAARAARGERQRRGRCEVLNSLGIRQLRITGNGSDLRLRLSTAARWLDGRQETFWGQPFYFNLPAEEIFTTPDCRETRGTLKASRPLFLGDGVWVHDLELEFRQGRVVAFAASDGKEALASFFRLDPAARYLGEIALVGEDSPLASSGLNFGHPIYDENAAAHVALGHGLIPCLRGGASRSASQLAALGCNRSALHVDMLFGSKDISIDAIESAGGAVPLLRQGAWGERCRLVPVSIPPENGKLPSGELDTD